MRKIFNQLRKYPAINAVVRSLLLKLKTFVDRAIRYWPVSGVVQFRFEDLILKLYSEADDALTSKLYYQKKWEYDILQWFSFFCKESNVIIDAGANVGLFSLIAIKTNSSAEVHAFEPNPNNIDRLKVNVKLNEGEGHIKIQSYALADAEGEVQFYLPSDKRISDISSVYKGHTRAFNDFEHTALSVRAVSLDSFFATRSRKIDLVKIDVELNELYVLKGMKQILYKDRPVVFCEIFNDVIKRKQNPNLQAEIREGYAEEVSDLLKEMDYFFYSITHDGLIEVPDFYYSPMSSMYLLLPKRLEQKHYMYKERHIVEKQL